MLVAYDGGPTMMARFGIMRGAAEPILTLPAPGSWPSVLDMAQSRAARDALPASSVAGADWGCLNPNLEYATRRIVGVAPFASSSTEKTAT